MADSSGVCTFCNFINNQTCRSQCPYMTSADPITNICTFCYLSNKYFFNYLCYSTCPVNTTIDNSNMLCVPNVVTVCNGNCLNGGVCNKIVPSKCDCPANYSGDFCQIFLDLKSGVEIINPGPIYQNEINSFTYQYYLATTNNYNVTWGVVPAMSNAAYLTGLNQDKLKIAAGAFPLGNSIINITYFDLSNLSKIVTSQSIFIINISVPDVSKFKCLIQYASTVFNPNATYGIALYSPIQLTMVYSNVAAVNNKLRLLDATSTSVTVANFSFKYFYQNDVGEVLPISADYVSTAVFSAYITITKNLIISIRNERGEVSSISIPIDIRANPNYNTSISDVLQSNSTSSITLYELNNYFYHNNTKLNSTSVTQVTDYLKQAFNQLINNPSSGMDQDQILSVFNQLVINQSQNNDDMTSINNLSSILQSFTNKINSLNDTSQISRTDLNSYYRSLDIVFNATNNYNYASNKGSDVAATAIYDTVKQSISNVNQYLSRGMDINERIVVSTQNFDSYIERPSPNQPLVQLQNVDKTNRSFTQSSDYTMDNQVKQSSCDINTYFCSDTTSFDNFKQFYNYSNSSNVSNLAIFVINMNNSHLYNGTNADYKPLSTTSFSIDVYDTNSNSTAPNIVNFKYDISLSISSNDSVITNNSACVSLPTTVSKCSTYYNYTSSKTICRCSGGGDVVNVYNITLSTEAKLYQFPPWKLDYLNPISICLIFSSIFIMVSFSIILLIYDYYDDKNFLQANRLNDHQIINNEFKDLTNLQGAGLFSFALYITMYIYPFLSVFSLYNYDQPRFMRFCVEILSILMSLSFSLLPYYQKPFTYLETFIQKRDITTSADNVNNLPAKIKDYIASILYSVFATIVMSIVLFTFSSLMQWNVFMLKIWKYRKDVINKYIRAYMIQPLLLPEKWKALKLRILALNRLCGKWILKKHLAREEERNKHFVYKFMEKNPEIMLKKSTKYFNILELLTKEKTKMPGAFSESRNEINIEMNDVNVKKRKFTQAAHEGRDPEVKYLSKCDNFFPKFYNSIS